MFKKCHVLIFNIRPYRLKKLMLTNGIHSTSLDCGIDSFGIGDVTR